MSKNNDDYEDRILWVKGEFINFLRRNIEKRSDKNIDQQEVRSLVYRFILENVLAGKKVKTKEEKKRLFIDLFIEVINFCLTYGDVIIQTLSRIREYKDFEEIQLNDSDIDA